MEPFEELLADILDLLRDNAFPNEQSVIQGVVLPVLKELGWCVRNPRIVWPEYQTGGGRVDIALCHPPSKPAVFIEVKMVGNLESGIRQVLEYAFHSGVPFVVLTDGRIWSFYLPSEQGSYEDRRVYKLDLFERDIQEAVSVLHKYLYYDRTINGQALETARKEYRDRNRRLIAQKAIPEAWNELVARRDETLVELIMDAVASKVGHRPEEDDVINFLVSNIRSDLPPHSPPPPPPPKSGNVIINGKAYNASSAKDAVVIVLRELVKTDPDFFERCYQHKGFHGKKRHYIARSIDELYPKRPDLREFHAVLPHGWFLATNLSNQIKRKIIQAAAEVAGLTFGKDIIINF